MSDNKSSQYKASYPDVVRHLFDTPELLPDENLKDFFQLFDSLEAYLKPETDWGYLVTYQATMLTWDNLRYQKMKVGMLLNHRRAALESLLRKSHVDASTKGGPELFAKAEAEKDARRWFSDPASRPAIMARLEKAGYPPNAVEVEAFQLALPSLATIERLIVSAQKRLDAFLNQLEKTSKASAEALRVATTKAIDPDASGQRLTS